MTTESDIVEVLRRAATLHAGDRDFAASMERQAADEIERLRASYESTGAALGRSYIHIGKLWSAIEEHHHQKADDRCIEDDDKLYAAAGLPPCDRRVGDKTAMLANCQRFIENRCQGGGWKPYAELEVENARLRAKVDELQATVDQWGIYCARLA